MVRQVGSPKLNKNGIIQKGVIIRHLVLPNHIENSKKVLKWIKENLPKEIYISIMAQYFPTYKAKEEKDINRKLTQEEWAEIEKYVEKLGIENGYIQELGEHEEEYVPNWDVPNGTKWDRHKRYIDVSFGTGTNGTSMCFLGQV